MCVILYIRNYRKTGLHFLFELFNIWEVNMCVCIWIARIYLDSYLFLNVLKYSERARICSHICWFSPPNTSIRWHWERSLGLQCRLQLFEPSLPPLMVCTVGSWITGATGTIKPRYPDVEHEWCLNWYVSYWDEHFLFLLTIASLLSIQILCHFCWWNIHHHNENKTNFYSLYGAPLYLLEIFWPGLVW